MKKQSVLVMVLVLVLAMIVGCGQEAQSSEYVGKWRATEAALSDVTVNVEDVYGKMVLKFEEKGTVTLITEDGKMSDSWEPTEDGVTIHLQGKAFHLKKVKDNVLAGEFGGITFSFEQIKEK